MAWFLIGVLSTVLMLGLLALISVAEQIYVSKEDERARIEAEVRRAERRLHDVAASSFRSILEQARTNDGKARKWSA